MRRTLAAVGLSLTASAVARAQAPHNPVTAPQPAAAAREARGLVSRITPKGDVPLAGNWVVLHRVGNDVAAPIDSMRTDARGKFDFHYRATGDTAAMYFIASSYDGIAYFTPPLRNAITATGDADLLVYDTTSAPVPIHVRGRHVIVTAPDTGKTRGVIEVYELSNDSSRHACVRDLRDADIRDDSSRRRDRFRGDGRRYSRRGGEVRERPRAGCLRRSRRESSSSHSTIAFR